MNKTDIKEAWKILNVEGSRELIMLNGLIKLILKSRGLDIKGIDKDSVEKVIELMNRDDIE